MHTDANIVAQQKINTMYANSTGAASQYKTIQIITAISVIFGIVSVVGSAIGFNYDFKILMPDYSVFTAIILAVALESARLASIMGFFSFKQFEIRGIFASLMIILTVLAIVLHIRGMESMAIVKTNEAIKEVMEHNQKIEMMKQQRADTLLSSSVKAQESVLNNGTKYDDRLMVRTMQDNTSLIADLSKKQTISDTEARYLVAQKDQAETLQKVGSIILPLIEIFALFGFFAAFLKTRAVSQPVKNVVDTRHSLSALEASKTMYQPSPTQQVEEEMGKQIQAKLIEDFSARNGVKNDPKSDQKLNGDESTEKTHKLDLENDSKTEENLKNKINIDECEDEEPVGYKEEQQKREEELFTVNLMVYPNSHNEIIKTMFDYGNVKKGNFLVEKNEVRKKLGISDAEFQVVAKDLVKNKHIAFVRGRGYMALSDLENEVKTTE